MESSGRKVICWKGCLLKGGPRRQKQSGQLYSLSLKRMEGYHFPSTRARIGEGADSFFPGQILPPTVNAIGKDNTGRAQVQGLFQRLN